MSNSNINSVQECSLLSSVASDADNVDSLLNTAFVDNKVDDDAATNEQVVKKEVDVKPSQCSSDLDKTIAGSVMPNDNCQEVSCIEHVETEENLSPINKSAKCKPVFCHDSSLKSKAVDENQDSLKCLSYSPRDMNCLNKKQKAVTSSFNIFLPSLLTTSIRSGRLSIPPNFYHFMNPQSFKMENVATMTTKNKLIQDYQELSEVIKRLFRANYENIQYRMMQRFLNDDNKNLENAEKFLNEELKLVESQMNLDTFTEINLSKAKKIQLDYEVQLAEVRHAIQLTKLQYENIQSSPNSAIDRIKSDMNVKINKLKVEQSALFREVKQKKIQSENQGKKQKSPNHVVVKQFDYYLFLKQFVFFFWLVFIIYTFVRVIFLKHFSADDSISGYQPSQHVNVF